MKFVYHFFNAPTAKGYSMKKIILCFITVIVFEGCNKDSNLVNGFLQHNYSKKEVSAILPKSKFLSKKANYSYKVYKIIYQTKDFDGEDINASGTVSIPDTGSKKMNLVINCHPTFFLKDKAPSGSKALSAAPIFTGKSGFITIEPDYIGFGASKKRDHLYFVKEQSSTAVADFAKASLDFIKFQQIQINKIYLTGYSEGGYIALASLKKLEDMGIKVDLTTPMAGIYFLDAVAKEVLKYKKLEKPSVIAAIALSYSKAYDVDLSEIVNSYEIPKLKKLFSGIYPKKYIDANLPKEITGKNGIFKKSFVSNYEDSWFQEALQDNKTVDFIPNSPIRFIHCIGDNDIPYQLSDATVNIFKNYLFASDVKLIPVEPFITQNSKTRLRLNHKSCAIAAYKISNFLFVLNSKEQ